MHVILFLTLTLFVCSKFIIVKRVTFTQDRDSHKRNLLVQDLNLFLYTQTYHLIHINTHVYKTNKYITYACNN